MVLAGAHSALARAVERARDLSDESWDALIDLMRKTPGSEVKVLRLMLEAHRGHDVRASDEQANAGEYDVWCRTCGDEPLAPRYLSEAQLAAFPEIARGGQRLVLIEGRWV